MFKITQPGIKSTKSLREFGPNAVSEDATRFLSSHPRVDANSRDDNLAAPLHIAMQVYDPPLGIASVLLQSPNIDVNVRGPEGVTPLMLAAALNNTVVVRELLRDKRVNVRLIDDKNRDALHYAGIQKNIGVYQLISRFLKNFYSFVKDYSFFYLKSHEPGFKCRPRLKFALKARPI